ncbi:hypothetical protein QN360_17015, partial [Glaciimonas sp. CA11.2]|uniref:hypothetical protein n=1 Tax=Glaciimonas sp. CA11.2 TaxID=3048601 RepID=UPI002B2398C3
MNLTNGAANDLPNLTWPINPTRTSGRSRLSRISSHADPGHSFSQPSLGGPHPKPGNYFSRATT